MSWVKILYPMHNFISSTNYLKFLGSFCVVLIECLNDQLNFFAKDVTQIAYPWCNAFHSSSIDQGSWHPWCWSSSVVHWQYWWCFQHPFEHAKHCIFLFPCWGPRLLSTYGFQKLWNLFLAFLMHTLWKSKGRFSCLV